MEGKAGEVVCTDGGKATQDMAVQSADHVGTEGLECPMTGEVGVVGGTEGAAGRGIAPGRVGSWEETSDSKGAGCTAECFKSGGG